MNTLKNYVEWKLTHSDKTTAAEGYPLILEKCKKNKKMKDLKVYGNSQYMRKNWFNCSSAKTLYTVWIYPGSFTSTETGVAWNTNTVESATIVFVDLGLASNFAGKTMTASFDIEIEDESLINTQFVVCNADGSNRVAIGAAISEQDGHYYVKATIGTNYINEHLTIRFYITNAKLSTRYEFKNIMVSESDGYVPYAQYYQSPENPIEIQSVGEKTKNLYSVDNVYLYNVGWNLSRDLCVITDDSITTYATADATQGSLGIYLGNVTEYAGKTICMSFTAETESVRAPWTGIVLYDSSGSPVNNNSSAEWEGGYYGTITIPDDIDDSYSLRIRLYGQNLTKGCEVKIGNIMIVEGSEPLPYAPYDKYIIPVVQSGKNIFKPARASANGVSIYADSLTNSYGTTISTTDLSANTIQITQVPNENYNVDTFRNGFFAIQVSDSLVIGKKYILSYDVDITSNPRNADHINIIVNGNGSTVGDFLSGQTKKRMTHTFVFGAKRGDTYMNYIEIRCMGMSFTASNFMITEEGYDENFEPYSEPIIYNVFLDEPLRKVEDYADYIDSKQGKVIRNVLKKTYDGRPSVEGGNYWALISSSLGDSGEYAQFSTRDDTLDILPGYDDATSSRRPIVVPLCMQFPVSTHPYNSKPNTVDKEQWFCVGLAQNIRPIILKSRLTYTEGDNESLRGAFAKWLRENPVTVYYALWNPVEGEDISNQLPKITEKTTIFIVDSTLEPSDMYGKYIK